MIKTLVEIILIYIDFELLSINVVRQNKRAVAEREPAGQEAAG